MASKFITVTLIHDMIHSLRITLIIPGREQRYFIFELKGLLCHVFVVFA